ncbi:Mic1 domain-containing protein [Entamoeba marina]
MNTTYALPIPIRIERKLALPKNTEYMLFLYDDVISTLSSKKLESFSLYNASLSNESTSIPKLTISTLIHWNNGHSQGLYDSHTHKFYQLSPDSRYIVAPIQDSSLLEKLNISFNNSVHELKLIPTETVQAHIDKMVDPTALFAILPRIKHYVTHSLSKVEENIVYSFTIKQILEVYSTLQYTTTDKEINSLEIEYDPYITINDQVVFSEDAIKDINDHSYDKIGKWISYLFSKDPMKIMNFLKSFYYHQIAKHEAICFLSHAYVVVSSLQIIDDISVEQNQVIVVLYLLLYGIENTIKSIQSNKLFINTDCYGIILNVVDRVSEWRLFGFCAEWKQMAYMKILVYFLQNDKHDLVSMLIERLSSKEQCSLLENALSYLVLDKETPQSIISYVTGLISKLSF